MPMAGRRYDAATGLLELTELQAKFLDWLCGERAEGETQAKFAQDNGISTTTLGNWKRDPSFIGHWERRLRQTHAAPDVINAHLDALNRKARTGDVQAIKLYHEIVNRMWPEDTNQDEHLAELTDQQLLDLAESMDLLRARSEDTGDSGPTRLGH